MRTFSHAKLYLAQFNFYAGLFNVMLNRRNRSSPRPGTQLCMELIHPPKNL